MPKPPPGKGRPGPPRKADPYPASSCDCRDCQAACLNSPGWFMPRQIPALAGHLNLEIEELFRRHLAVGVTKMADGSLRHGVMPHKLRDGKKPGSVWTINELATPGRCVFFDRGRCTIYPVRPYECARMIHDRQGESVKLRHYIVKKWDEAALRPFAKLTGARLFAGAPKGKDKQGEKRPGTRTDRRRS